MSKMFTCLLSSWLCLQFSITAWSSIDREEVLIEAEELFIPYGFDSNDIVEVVVTGELLNTCFRRPFGEVFLSEGKIYVEVKATVVSGPDVACIEVLVPFVTTVSLGSLREGNYEIVVNPNLAYEKTGDITIGAPNSSSIDNFTYANVTNVKKIDGTHTLTEGYAIAIEGYHPSTCLEIDRIEVLPNNIRNTFSILPIVKQTRDICDCAVKPFSYVIDLPRDSNKKAVLAHVRSILGNAVNFVVDNNI